MAHLDLICVLLGICAAGRRPDASKSYIAVLQSLLPITRCEIQQMSLITPCAIQKMIHQMSLMTACIHAHGAAQLAELGLQMEWGPARQLYRVGTSKTSVSAVGSVRR